jgi:SnoaL-like domain
MAIKTNRGEDNPSADIVKRLAAMQSELKELRDSEMIKEGLYRYCTAIDRCDLDLLKSCYHPDAVDMHSNTFCGNAMKFAEYIIPEMQKLFSVHHSIGNISIELKADRAFVQSQFQGQIRVNLVDEDAAQGFVEYNSRGRYLDIWENREGDWRISFRYLVDDGNTLRLIKDQPPLQHTDYGGRPSGDDPYYFGFGITALKTADRHGIDVRASLRSRCVQHGTHPSE